MSWLDDQRRKLEEQKNAGTLRPAGVNMMNGTGTPDPNKNINLPYFEEDRARLGGMLQGQSPFAGGEWGGLVSQLQQQASGAGPSMAQQAYRQASQDTTNSLGSLARGSASPGAARAAVIQQGRVGQGMASGLASARTQEQMAAQQALAGTLGARDSLNQGAYMGVLGHQLGLSGQQLGALQGDRQYALAQQQMPSGLEKVLGIASGIATGAAGLGYQPFRQQQPQQPAGFMGTNAPRRQDY
jgi:hypothetical protein